MDKLDKAVADHLEWRLLDPPLLTAMMEQVLEHRQEWNDRRRGHIAELHAGCLGCGPQIGESTVQLLYEITGEFRRLASDRADQR